jgi:hypothetical protein
MIPCYSLLVQLDRQLLAYAIGAVGILGGAACEEALDLCAVAVQP